MRQKKNLMKILAILTIIIPGTLSLTHCVNSKNSQEVNQQTLPEQIQELISSLNLWINKRQFTSNQNYNEIIKLINGIARVLNGDVEIVLEKEKEGTLKLKTGPVNLIKAKLFYGEKVDFQVVPKLFEILFTIVLKNVEESFIAPRIRLDNVVTYLKSYTRRTNDNFKNIKDIINLVIEDLWHIESNVLVRNEDNTNFDLPLKEGMNTATISFEIKGVKRIFKLNVLKEASLITKTWWVAIKDKVKETT